MPKKAQKIAPKFIGRVKDGKLKVQKPDELNLWLGYMDGKQVEIIIREPGRAGDIRSNAMNRYYWGVVVALIAEHVGYTPEEAHNALKMKFLGRSGISGLPTIKSTTQLTTEEFMDYTETVREWAAQELQVIIPLPGEVDIDTNDQ